jgi:hypothetical protein
MDSLLNAAGSKLTLKITNVVELPKVVDATEGSFNDPLQFQK